MQKTIKNVLFGALAAVLVATAFTATAKSAFATADCEPCDFGSGYMVASGFGDPVCVDESDPRYVEQCGGGGR